MKSRKYPTLQIALEELKSIGVLKFHGSEGDHDIYSLDLKGVRYILAIYKDGKVELLYEINPWRG